MRIMGDWRLSDGMNLPQPKAVVPLPTQIGEACPSRPGTHLRGCSSVVERHVANVNVGRSNRLTRFDESALPDPGGAFSWAEREAWFTPDSHPDAPDRTVSCTEWWHFWWQASEALPWVPVATCPSEATAGRGRRNSEGGGSHSVRQT